MKYDIQISKIKAKKTKIGIIGLGYVGLPLALAFAESDFFVVGFDIDKKRVAELNKGTSYISDVAINNLVKHRKNNHFVATTDFKQLARVDIIFICVPTPLGLHSEPDLSYIIEATQMIKKYMAPGQLVVLESTTFPGTTEEIIKPILDKKNKTVGRDYYLAFSPERIDPGNKDFPFKSVPKVVGGVTKTCGSLARAIYQEVFPSVMLVSSPKVAEMEKLLENIFRNVNIALVNELAFLCKKMGISIWEVIEAAKTKPYGFMPFYPGPGLGGHCIPVDPFYLSWKAKSYGFRTRFIELAGEINSSMPFYIRNIVQNSLNDFGKSIKNSRILILGVAYKKDIGDTRESPALDLISLLEEFQAEICFNDPFVPSIRTTRKKYRSVKLTKKLLKKIDCCVLITNHSQYDYDKITQSLCLLVDTRNAIKNSSINKKCHLIKL